MKTIFTIAFILHMLAIIGILSLLLHQAFKSPRKLSGGVLHSALTALIAGVVMVGTWTKVNPNEELNHTKVGIKLLVVVVILVIGYANVKKPELKKNTWLTLIGLTVLNIIIATSWK
jgi:uncharacterized membrane protein YadS